MVNDFHTFSNKAAALQPPKPDAVLINEEKFLS
jgi:hypothetical protein